jgi:long-chain acyl-CoA synthetase
MVEIPEAANLTDAIFAHAAEQPQQIALRRKHGDATSPTWQDITASEFRDEVTALAKGLIAAGIEAGDRVALLSRTRYEWPLIDYALWTTGAVVVPVYETSAAEQVEWILSDAGVRAIFVETDAHAQTVASVRDRLPALEHVWVIENDKEGDLAALTAAGAAVTDDQVAKRRAAPGAADLATIIYTSGTTGRAKGCRLTHGNLLADARNSIALSGELFEPGISSTLLFLPLAHVLARTIEVMCIESGTIIGHTPSITNLVPDLVSFRPTFLLAVPRVFEKVYNGAELQASASPATARIFRAATQTAISYSRALGATPGEGRGPGTALKVQHAVFDRLVYAKLRAAVGGQVQYAVSGGGALGERLGHFFRGVGITILEGYGLTETTAAVTVNTPERNKIGTVGRPIPGAAIKIADDGEILAQGPNIFTGYWQNDEANGQTFADDSWMRTGDVGELDDEGFLRITGRKKELIVTAGGKNVAPAPLEDHIRAHPLISQCMVVGDGKPYIACLITLDEEAIGPWKARNGKPADMTPAQLADDPDLRAEIQKAIDGANATVSRAEGIKRFRILGIDFTEENNMLTPSLKVRRNIVAKELAAEIAALYA